MCPFEHDMFDSSEIIILTEGGSGRKKKKKRAVCFQFILTYICISHKPGCCADDSLRRHTVLLRTC